MEFSEVKQTFIKEMVRNGYQSWKDIPGTLTEGIPTRLMERWMKQLKEIPALTSIPQNPRLINRFTMGADPEFSFLDGAKLYPAMKLGLQTGLAFGMDMNGRLAELRPAPSRFVLDIIASILAELRWMAMYLPTTLKLQWISKPFDGQDGVGGHVHLGRRRGSESWMKDVTTLGSLYHGLVRTNVFNKELNDDRVEQTKYGQKNDTRPQKYGYEYRGFPTWLDSPWMAYLVLVLTKLSLYDSNLIMDLTYFNQKNARNTERAIANLLYSYKNADDDAWIACHALRKWGMPQQQGGDFKSNWGILYPYDLKQKVSAYYPDMIIGSEEERLAVFNYLVNREEIKPTVPVCNWQPADLPEEYWWMMNNIQTYHKTGLGEIGNSLVYHSKHPVKFEVLDHKDFITVYTNTIMFNTGLQELCKLDDCLMLDFKPNVAPGVGLRIHFPSTLRTPEMIPKVKKVLTSGLLPIWSVKDVRESSYQEWVDRNKVQMDKKSIGKELVL